MVEHVTYQRSGTSAPTSTALTLAESAPGGEATFISTWHTALPHRDGHHSCPPHTVCHICWRIICTNTRHLCKHDKEGLCQTYGS